MAYFYPPGTYSLRDDGSFPYRHLSEMSDPERRFVEELAADIQASQPPLVLANVTDHCPPLPRPFQLLDYLVYSGALDEVMAPYRVVGVADGFAVYVKTAAPGALSAAAPGGAPTH